MKKITTILSVLICILLFSNINAKEINKTQAKDIAKSFLQQTKYEQNKSCDYVLDLVYERKSSINKTSTDLFYVFDFDNHGFVIVSADDRVRPILGYSFSNTFDPNDIPCNMELHLKDISIQIEYAIQENIQRDASIASQWEALLANKPLPNKNTHSVEPICKTTWHQNKYYNLYCPKDTAGPGGRVAAGCVATAMAQVMKALEYPVNGEGVHTYKPDNYDTLTVDYNESFNDFDIMPNYIDSTSSFEEISAVARFIYNCGVSVNMIYGPNGSGAFSENALSAFKNIFLYSQSAMLEYRYFHSNEEWTNILKGELDNGLPMYYAGNDDGGAGGHAFVCDGYDESNMFHLNWGWSGKYNGFYALGAFNTPKYSFNTMNMAILYNNPDPENIGKPTKPRNFNVECNYTDKSNDVKLSWTNPTKTMDNVNLSSTINIKIVRNNEIIKVLDNMIPRQTSSWLDENIEDGIYKYEIFAIDPINNNKEGMRATQSIIIGPSCMLQVHMFDSYGDGWQGGYVTVGLPDEGISEYKRLSLVSGFSGIEEVEVPTGNVSFYWTAGSYPNECSVKIYNEEGDLLFENESFMGDGNFFNTYSDCNNTSGCEKPNNITNHVGDLFVDLFWENTNPSNGYEIYRNNALIATVNDNTYHDTDLEYESEYTYRIKSLCNDSIESNLSSPVNIVTPYGTCMAPHDIQIAADGNNITLTWDSDNQVECVYNIYRNGEQINCFIEENTYTDSSLNMGTYTYNISSICAYHSESELSEPVEIILGIDDSNTDYSIYPNPTKDVVHINGEKIKSVVLYNSLGQILNIQSNIQDHFATIDISSISKGVYIIIITDIDNNSTSCKIYKY